MCLFLSKVLSRNRLLSCLVLFFSVIFGRPFVKRFALMLSDRCLSCLSVCPVCPVCNVRALWPNGWTDQDETWHAGRPRPGHIVLEGTQLPSPQGHSPRPQFLAHICCGQMAAWIKMPLGMELGLGPGDFVLGGDPASLPKRGRSPTPQFSAHFYCGQAARCIKMPLGMEVGLGLRDIVFVVDRATPRKKGTPTPTNFWPMSIVAKWLDG